MAKFCENCGTELKEFQDVCLGCGRMLPNRNNNIPIKKQKDHSGYVKVSGIIMIILGFCLICGMTLNEYEQPVLVFGLPGVFAIISGILSLCSKSNKNLLLLAGIFLIIGAVINFIGIIDISIFFILAIIFGILDIVYSRK